MPRAYRVWFEDNADAYWFLDRLHSVGVTQTRIVLLPLIKSGVIIFSLYWWP